jgi:hypothetical protein
MLIVHGAPVQSAEAVAAMLATLIDAPFDNKNWVFESKWDGFRLVAKIEKAASPFVPAAASSAAATTCPSARRWRT